MSLRSTIRAMIGRTRRFYRLRDISQSQTPSRDWSERDYAFWDKARRGKAKGLEISGLFLKPLGSKVASWTLGTLPRWTAGSDRANEVLAAWWSEHHSDVLRSYEEAVDLGHVYVVINPDLSITPLPPNVVEPIVDEADYSKLIGWRVTERHPHPTRPADVMTIIDEYTRDRRVHRVLKGSVELQRDEYPNLIGRLPIVPIPNARGINEVFGSPEGVALVPLLQQYGMVLDAALNGNKHQGRPTPVTEFESVAEMNSFWEWAEENGLLERTTRTLEDGTTEETFELRFDTDSLVTIAGGKFSWAQPGQFAGDTEKLLGLLFYLFLQHTEIPEFVWGNAIASSKASAEAQLPPFLKWIEKKRGEMRGWLLEVSRVVLAYSALWERGVGAIDGLTLAWDPLTSAEDAITLQAVQWAYASGLLTREAALEMLPLDIRDASEMVALADAEADERRANAPLDQMDMAQFRRDEQAAEMLRALAHSNGNGQLMGSMAA